MNPLYNQLNGNAPNNNQFSNMMKQFQEFKRTFSGNPQQQVQQLLNSGRMSQSQFNQLREMATQFQKLLR